MNKIIVNCAKRSYLYQNWWSFPLYSGTLVKFALCDKMRFSRFSVIYRLQTVRFFPVWVSLRVLGMKWRAHCIQRLYSSYSKIQNFQWKEDKEREIKNHRYTISKNVILCLTQWYCCPLGDVPQHHFIKISALYLCQPFAKILIFFLIFGH